MKARLLILMQIAVICVASAAGALRAPAGLVSPARNQTKDSRSSGTTDEMSAETIFSRYASRILFLTCDESSLASGVLVSADGFIVTNAHVVAGCRSVTASLRRGNTRQSYVPVLKYYDERSDVAVLKIAGHDFDCFTLPAHPAQIGERVYAIGNPRGLEQTITEGLVSGNRELDGVSWIQHSAPISPGSSGGALISPRGELLGINAFLLKESQNLNFAVPAATLATAISRARAVTTSLNFPKVQQDYSEEGIRTRKLAEQGNVDAEFILGFLYEVGHGVPQNYAEAAIWYRKAAEQGDASAQCSLGRAYYHGQGVEQDYAKATVWFRKAADQGNATGQFNLGVLYDEGHGVPQDSAQAANWYRKSAEQGDVDAQYSLGAHYSDGRGLPQDYAQAAVWYRKAAEQGDADAQSILGLFYDNGQGVPRDYAQAAIWYRKAADQGDASAQLNLGFLYQIGHGVASDYTQAAIWYRKAAEQGNADAQNNLSALYHVGLGVPQDYAQAAAWTRKAAEQGNAEAQYELGFMYQNGDGVPQDYSHAATWFRRVAEQGDAYAQLSLGALYAHGQGVPKDYAQAYFWLDLAASGKLSATKLKEATDQRDMSATHLSPAQLSQEQARASKWFVEHPPRP